MASSNQLALSEALSRGKAPALQAFTVLCRAGLAHQGLILHRHDRTAVLLTANRPGKPPRAGCPAGRPGASGSRFLSSARKPGGDKRGQVVEVAGVQGLDDAAVGHLGPGEKFLVRRGGGVRSGPAAAGWPEDLRLSGDLRASQVAWAMVYMSGFPGGGGCRAPGSRSSPRSAGGRRSGRGRSTGRESGSREASVPALRERPTKTRSSRKMTPPRTRMSTNRGPVNSSPRTRAAEQAASEHIGPGEIRGREDHCGRQGAGRPGTQARW